MQHSEQISVSGRAVVRMPDVCRQIGASSATVYRRIRAGTFPRPIKIGGTKIAFFADEVADWLAQRPRAEYRPLPSATTPTDGTGSAPIAAP